MRPLERALDAGTLLGPYEIVARLGSGGMGQVYLARDTRLDREVALKILASGAVGDPSARERFQQEALALSRLNHPNRGVLHRDLKPSNVILTPNRASRPRVVIP